MEHLDSSLDREFDLPDPAALETYLDDEEKKELEGLYKLQSATGVHDLTPEQRERYLTLTERAATFKALKDHEEVSGGLSPAEKDELKALEIRQSRGSSESKDDPWTDEDGKRLIDLMKRNR